MVRPSYRHKNGRAKACRKPAQESSGSVDIRVSDAHLRESVIPSRTRRALCAPTLYVGARDLLVVLAGPAQDVNTAKPSH